METSANVEESAVVLQACARRWVVQRRYGMRKARDAPADEAAEDTVEA